MATAATDLLNQTFNLTGLDGEPVSVATADFEQLKQLVVSSGIVFGTQLGLSIGVLAALLLTAEAARFRTIAFQLNVSALLVNVLRCALECSYQNSAASNFVIIQIGAYDLPGIKAAQEMSNTCTILTVILFTLIELSLIMQVKAIFSGVRRIFQRMVITFIASAALLALGFRIYLAVTNIIVVVHLTDSTAAMIAAETWAQKVANITSVISIGLSSLMFAGKAAHAIFQRWNMGIRQFGPLQIVFIFSCQTLIAPVIIAATAYFTLAGAQLQSFVETLVALFLPLSSIWASANTQAQISTGHPRAVLELPTHHATESSARDSRASDAGLIVPPAASTSVQPEIPTRRERSFWEQYGSRDSIMLDDLEISGEGIRARQVVVNSTLHNEISQESMDSKGASTATS